MNAKEKLIELLGNIYLPIMDGSDTIGEYSIPHKFKREIADHLIANGVTVQECKLGVKKTNADHIRSMSDEELAEFLTHINPTNCKDCAFSHGWRCQPDRNDYSDFEKCKEGRRRWLQQSAEED